MLFDMKKISFILLFCFSAFCSMAQIVASDSLKLVMDSYEKKDTIQLKNIRNYAFSLIDVDPFKANELFSNGMQLAKEIGYNEVLYKCIQAKQKLTIMQKIMMPLSQSFFKH
jgi:hypothetical protein